MTSGSGCELNGETYIETKEVTDGVSQLECVKEDNELLWELKGAFSNEKCPFSEECRLCSARWRDTRALHRAQDTLLSVRQTAH